ncbi:hypothetical protein NP493_183g03034 [Ridgeia piscesae]|uniref:Uncharacterized protein n=1 Tax=Ridgeia piscesae TaxID=27915 RepID=A0AAD9P2L0_RIDPI|nr:hypothetical protein NP493_183g03034 [Ridgeia piscesae]
MPITKVCPDCAKQMPTACKSCSSCNYTFRRDVSLPSPPPVTRDDTTAATTPATTPSTTVVRRTERTRRERPDYFDALEYEQYFKRERRKRSFSHSSASDDSCKKRGRPKGSIIKEKLHDKAETIAEANDSRSSGESAVKDEDLFASIPAEKAMQFAIVLAEINRKCVGQQFNPT